MNNVLTTPEYFVLDNTIENILKNNKISSIQNSTSRGLSGAFYLRNSFFETANDNSCQLFIPDNSGVHANFGNGNQIIVPYTNDKSLVIQTGIDPIALRKRLLYFDRLIIPKPSCGTSFYSINNEINMLFKNNDAFEFEIDTSDCLSISDIFIKIHDENTYTTDTIRYYKSSNKCIRDGGELKECIFFSIVNSLPVPHPETPIVKIIEYREKRKDIIRSFNQDIMDFATYIINEVEVDKIENQYIKSINGKIDIIIKTLLEEKIRTGLSNLSFSIKLDKTLISTIMGALLGKITGFPIEITTIAGSVLGSLNLEFKKSFETKNETKLREKHFASDFNYFDTNELQQLTRTHK